MSAPKSSASPDAEFMDCKAAVAHFGICETTLYKLMAEKKVKSVLLRDKGKVRGKRLFVVASVREYLTSLIQ